MNGEQIIDHFEYLIDDSIDSDRALILCNRAVDRVMMKRMWNFLRKTDQSNTIVATTRSYALPSDNLYPRKAKFYNSTTGDYAQFDLKPVRFEDRHRFNKVFGFFYIDNANQRIILTADPGATYAGWKLEYDYNHQPAELTTSTSPFFNRAFHVLPAFEMARMFWYGEQDEKDRSWNKEFKAEYDELYADMEAWDNMLETACDPDMQPVDSWVPEAS